MCSPPDDIYFREGLLQDNAKPAITKAWLSWRRDWVLNCPACSIDLSPIENIWHIIKRKMTTNSSVAGNLYRVRMGPNSNNKTQESHNLEAQTCFKLFCKGKEKLHQGEHVAVPNILRPVGNIKFETSSFIYALMWIQCWLMWSESLLVFILLKFKEHPNFLQFGFYIKNKQTFSLWKKSNNSSIFSIAATLSCMFHVYLQGCQLKHLLTDIWKGEIKHNSKQHNFLAFLGTELYHHYLGTAHCTKAKN